MWQNPELLQSAGCSHPDQASHKIIVAVWERLQSIDDSEFTEPSPEPFEVEWRDSTKKALARYFEAMGEDFLN